MTRLSSLALLVALSLAGGASQAAIQAESGPNPEGVRCLSVDRIIGRRPVPPDHVRLEMADGTIYLSTPPGRCPSLERAGRLDLILLELHGDQLCSGDQFRVVDPDEARAVGLRASPACRFGAFRAETARP
jgi:hypothetical protein